MKRAAFLGLVVCLLASGRRKVAELLLKFMKTDPAAKMWFTQNAGENR